MDDIVKAAMAKWPNVPHCHGWLALDTRGDWYMRDERVQRLGSFAQAKGTRIDHAALLAFIHRNYARDDVGCWFFQNGPQRVYVELEAAPWVWRIDLVAGSSSRPERLAIMSHTGLATSSGASYLDERGRLFIDSGLGLGLVHTQDMVHAAHALEHGLLSAPSNVLFAALPRLGGFVLSPQAELAPRPSK